MGPRVRKLGSQQGLQPYERVASFAHIPFPLLRLYPVCMHVSVHKTGQSSDNSIYSVIAGQMTRAWQQYFNRSVAILLSNLPPTIPT